MRAADKGKRRVRHGLPDGVDWITGGSSGIGRALALRMAKAGRRVAISAPDPAELDAVVAQAQGLSGSLVPLPLDVTDAAAAAATVQRIESELGPLAVAVLNAGIYRSEEHGGFDLAAFERTIEVNLLGVGRCLAPALAAMRRRGRGQVALTGSVVAHRGWPGAASYGASKAALMNLAESLAGGLAEDGIKLQIVSPGFVATPLLRDLRFKPPFMIPPEEAAEAIFAGLTTRRFEIAFPGPMILRTRFVRRLPNRLALALIARSARRAWSAAVRR